MNNEEKIRKDCQFFKSTADKGCIALNKLYCKTDKKHCCFYKKRGAEVK